MILHRYIDPNQRANWESHSTIFFNKRDGNLYQTNSFSKFFKLFELDPGNMARLVRGAKSYHQVKGFTVWNSGHNGEVIEHIL